MRKALPTIFLTILALFLMTSCDRTLEPDSTFIGSSDIELSRRQRHLQVRSSDLATWI